MGILENLAYSKAKRAALDAIVASCDQPDSPVPDEIVFMKNSRLESFTVRISFGSKQSQLAWGWESIRLANFDVVGLGVAMMIKGLLIAQQERGTG